MQQLYVAERKTMLDAPDVCPLCDARTIESYTHWSKIPNKYPYDAVTTKHDQLVPKRHTNGDDLTGEELAELDSLKKTALSAEYSFVMETLSKSKSIPGHFHLHLITPKVV